MGDLVLLEAVLAQCCPRRLFLVRGVNDKHSPRPTRPPPPPTIRIRGGGDIDLEGGRRPSGKRRAAPLLNPPAQITKKQKALAPTADATWPPPDHMEPEVELEEEEEEEEADDELADRHRQEEEYVAN